MVLGADQLLEVEGEWLEKPVDLEARAASWSRLRGRRHRLVSAVVAFRGGSRVWHHADAADSGLRPFTDAFLDRLSGGCRRRTSWAASAPTRSRGWGRS